MLVIPGLDSSFYNNEPNMRQIVLGEIKMYLHLTYVFLLVSILMIFDYKM